MKKSKIKELKELAADHKDISTWLDSNDVPTIVLVGGDAKTLSLFERVEYLINYKTNPIWSRE